MDKTKMDKTLNEFMDKKKMDRILNEFDQAVSSLADANYVISKKTAISIDEDTINGLLDSINHSHQMLYAMKQELREQEPPVRRDVCWWCGGQLIWQNDWASYEMNGETGCPQ